MILYRRATTNGSPVPYGPRIDAYSIANDAGTSMRDISSAMGHSNISITSDVYTHDFNQLKSKAVNAVAESISRLQSAQASGKENMPIQQENAEENTTLNRLQKVRKGIGKRQ